VGTWYVPVYATCDQQKVFKTQELCRQGFQVWNKSEKGLLVFSRDGKHETCLWASTGAIQHFFSI